MPHNASDDPDSPNGTDERGTQDVTEVGQRKRKRRRAQRASVDQRRADYRWLMQEPAGRRLVWSWLERSGVYQSSFRLHSGEMAFREGRRDNGLELLTDVVAYAPDHFHTMQQECRTGRPTQEEQNRDDRDTESSGSD